jgi:hypothetical protein
LRGILGRGRDRRHAEGGPGGPRQRTGVRNGTR